MSAWSRESASTIFCPLSAALRDKHRPCQLHRTVGRQLLSENGRDKWDVSPGCSQASPAGSAATTDEQRQPRDHQCASCCNHARSCCACEDCGWAERKTEGRPPHRHWTGCWVDDPRQQLPGENRVSAQATTEMLSRLHAKRGNPILQHIRNIGWEYGDIVPDYQVGVASCVLFLR